MATIVRRGTTPTITTRVNADLTGMDIYLAFKLDKQTLLIKTGSDLDIEYETQESGEVYTIVSVALTQEDTLAMKAGKSVEIQIRAVMDHGDIAIATDIEAFQVERILQDGVLPQ